ncbi:DNA polymerase/3'-5' exonuclease PolX [Sporomusa termitida]|uniref:DNA-directed DNA polymerase n=1 Tax=Sporomusa termitida TaxID=2377 RepID=A0A517E0R2_9FIRM|nr:DNA polymerase/3'-5' exonuclease PolX [Sporomusa termitida]QDR83195.1 DNA polymerase/3'-5' exonuclease PolX [Sporomusa termitida]
MSDKYELARLLAEIAQLLELGGENIFKIRAYQNAARTIEKFDGNLTDPDAEARLTGLKGIGQALREIIHEYIATGRISYYEELKSSLPPGLFELMALPGLGAKKAWALHAQLGIQSLGELEYACRENRLVTLAGFGSKTQERILQGIEDMKKFRGQFILGDAWPVADLLVEYIKLQPGVERAAIVGSIRRGVEVVSSIEILAACSAPAGLAAGIRGMQGSDHVISDEADKCVIRLVNGLICTIYIVGADEYWPALVYHTGSSGYVAKLADQARRQGLLFSAAGLQTASGEPVAVPDEQGLYSRLQVNYAEPECREDEDKLSPAGSEQAVLMSLSDIRGIFHVHTSYSDGSASLADMAAAARQRGWKYLGIADHSRTAVYARGLSIETVRAQRREIEAWNAKQAGFIILAGIESDILPDGSLDYPDEILAGFDFVVASVHSAFRQSEADMTRRIVKAVQNRYVTMLGHPTGRLLLGRKGYAVNLTEVIQAAAHSGTILEINASPHRLDLDWRWCRLAKEQGVLFAINPDAHAVSEFDYMRYGVAVARKAGLAAGDIINTQPFPAVLPLLQQKRQ